MCNLEQGRHAERFGQVRSHATECVVGEKDIFLDLPVNVLHGPRIRKA